MKRVLISVVALSVPFLVQASADGYRLQPGDVVEIGVANYAALKQRLPVQMDGSLSLPLVGTLPAQGLTLTELRLSVQGAFESRVWRVRLPDGREDKLTISGMRLPGSTGLIVKVMLHRQGPDKAESFEAQGETILIPGDSLDVTVQGSRYEPGAGAQR